MNNSRHHITEYVLGFLTGLAIGLWCIDTGMRRARESAPPFPVITAERPAYPTPLAP